jgi:hypothetical protein
VHHVGPYVVPSDAGPASVGPPSSVPTVAGQPAVAPPSVAPLRDALHAVGAADLGFEDDDWVPDPVFAVHDE